MKCADCRHWDGDTGQWREIDDIGTCGATPQLWDATEWSEKAERVIQTKHADALAFVQDGSDYRAVLYTKSKFFCAMFKAKEASA
jgi:hypothetical protein